MLRILVSALFLLSVATGLQDVPLGTCFECEVTCIKDCGAKFESEVMSDDSLLQLTKKVNTSNLRSKATVINPEIQKMFKMSEQLAKEYK